MPRSIMKLPANTKGKDVVIADLHGNRECLDSIIAEYKFKSGDRLFIAGDLVDRGEDSVGIIETILNSKVSIHPIRGNHEEMTLRSINALEGIVLDIMKEGGSAGAVISKEMIMKKINASLSGQNVINLIRHISDANGGGWIVKLFAKELSERKISLRVDGEIDYKDDSKVMLILNYMNSLPYIIHVEGEGEITPFNVVHADMPINDLELKRRLINGKELSEKEKKYAIWIREEYHDPDIGRTPLSTITYCGHTIIGLRKGDCLRRQTSMVNLDFGAYSTNISLAVNHTNRQSKAVLNSKKKLDRLAIQGAKNKCSELQAYFTEKHFLNQMRKIMKECIQEINDAPVDKQIDTLIGVTKINKKIQTAYEYLAVPEWDYIEFINYVHTDPDISDELAMNFNKRMVDNLISLAEQKSFSMDSLLQFNDQIEKIAAIYNFYRKPISLLNYDALLDKLSPYPTVAEMGLFTAKSAPLVSSFDRVEGLIQELYSQFIDDKEMEYLDSHDLNKIIKDVADLMIKLNSLIDEHNDKHIDELIEPLTAVSFYRNNHSKLFAEHNADQEQFVNNSLAIEDIKRQLLKVLKKCHENEIDEMLKSSYQMVVDVVNNNNLSSVKVINGFTFDEFKRSILNDLVSASRPGASFR